MDKSEAISCSATEENSILPGGLIPLEEWELPAATVSRTLVGTFHNWLEQLRVGISRRDEAFESLDGLPELGVDELGKVAPEPDCRAHGQAVADEIQRLRSEGLCQRAVVVVVAQPFTGIARALRSLPDCKLSSAAQDSSKSGERLGYQLILPPDNLMMDEAAAKHWWQQQSLDQPWVISELAAFWRRHHDGLALVQELLRLVATEQAGEGVIGCSSWCWQFWSSYYPDAQLTPWAPAPMTGERLGLWLQQLAAASNGQVPVIRTTTDGLHILPLESPDECKKNKKKRKRSNLLRNLAADSRGISGVALAIWRKALRNQPEGDDSKQQSKNNKESAQSWAVPLDKLKLPVMPVSPEYNLGIVLHALLLHDGLSKTDLALVTAVQEPELSLVLLRLKQAEIIAAALPVDKEVRRIASLNTMDAAAKKDTAEDSKIWRVTPLGYSTTRRHLQSWGFPVDVF